MSGRGLELLWYMKHEHPDQTVRSATAAVLAELIERSPASDIASQVRECLDQERGTTLEPFVLDASDVEDVCDLAVLATLASRELLVVSRDKVEPDGGLLLKVNPLQGGGRGVDSRYVERFATARCKPAPPRAWRFAPGLRPAASDVGAGLPRIRAYAGVDAKGHWLSVGSFPPTLDAHKTVVSMAKAGPADGSGPVRWHIEMSSSGDGRELWLRPARPEDAIQLTALMLRRSWVVLSLGGTVPAIDRVALHLAVPQDPKGVVLAAVCFLGEPAFDALGQWLRVDDSLGVRDRLGPDQLAALGSWLGLDPSWRDEDVLERLR